MSRLFVVATPIGNLDDISKRAVDVLSSVDLIAAEDTRHSQRLLQHYSINTKVIALHEHNEQQSAAELIRLIQAGKSIALISDAGTPLISDPGFRLVRMAREAEIKVSPIPGACAAIAALSAAGLASDRFCFEGFLPAKQQARQNVLQALQNEMRSLIFYESPHRVLDCLLDMQTVFGAERELVVARELTKQFETFYAGKISDVIAWMQADANQQRGEFVLLLKGFEQTQQVSVESLKTLKVLLAELPMKQAVKLAAEITGEKKNLLYDLALEMK